LSLLNVDAFIVRQNVTRAVQGEELDVAYLASLSTDATPALAAAFQSPSLPAGTRDSVGASLACIQAGASSRQDTSWQSFQFSRLLDARALQSAQNDLKGYQIVDDDWQTRVITPQGQEYECLGYGMGD